MKLRELDALILKTEEKEAAEAARFAEVRNRITPPTTFGGRSYDPLSSRSFHCENATHAACQWAECKCVCHDSERLPSRVHQNRARNFLGLP